MEKQLEKELAIDPQDVVPFILRTIRLRENTQSYAPDADVKWKSLENIEFPKEGGLLCYFKGDPYPQKGFPHVETTQKINDVKKIAMGVLMGFKGFKGKWLLAFLFMLYHKRITKILTVMVQNFHRMLKPHFLKEKRYSTSIRALYAAFENRKELLDYREVICMILEFDDSYRYRYQYMLGQLNQESFRKNPLKELSRLLDLMYEAEIDYRLPTYWKLGKTLLFLASFFRGVREEIVWVISRLDPEKVKLDKADLYFCKTHHNLFVKDGSKTA